MIAAVSVEGASQQRRRAWVMAVVGVAAIVVAWWLGDQLTPRGIGLGVIGVGALIGSLNALGAVGLILVYRAGRYINFAHAGLGAVGAVVAGKLMVLYATPYLLAAAVGVAVAVLLAVLAELAVIRRLFTAPRLILTVATIGLAQVFGGFELMIDSLWSREGLETAPPAEITVPLDVSVRIGGVIFGGAHLLVLVVMPLAVLALIALFRFTYFGAAVQASAENEDRARLLGISTRRISTAVWVLVGLLSGVSAILQAPIVGFTLGAGAGPALLLRALAPAMLAGMSRMGLAVGIALVLGVVEQAVVFNTAVSGPVAMILFLLIVLGLLVQRRRGRADQAGTASLSGSSRLRRIPRELTSLREVRISRYGLRAILLGVAVLLPVWLSVSQQNLASLLLIYSIAIISLTVLSGYSGQISFGHWAFVGFGAMATATLLTTTTLPLLVVVLVVPLVGTLVAVFIGLPALRIRGLYLGVVTLAFAVASAAYLLQLPMFEVRGLISRPVIGPFDLTDELTFYYATLVVFLLVVLVVTNLRRSRWGRNVIALRDNAPAAASYGIRSVRTRLSAFALSGGLASLAGLLYALNQTTASAAAFGVDTSLLLFSAAVIGGIGSVPGAILGAVYLRGLQFLAPALQLVTTSFGLLAILMFAPEGLIGLIHRGRDFLLRWLANRRGILVPSLVADQRVDDEPESLPDLLEKSEVPS